MITTESSEVTEKEEAKRIAASQMKALFQRRFETDLQEINARLLKPKERKRYPKILEKVGRLKDKHRRVSGYYGIVEVPSSDGLQATAVHWTLQILRAKKLTV